MPSAEQPLTQGEASLLVALREADNWDDWILFVNLGFKMREANSLAARGLIDISEQLGMPAARLVGNRAMKEAEVSQSGAE